MRKLLMLATLALLGAFALSACDKQDQTQNQTETAALTRPASSTDTKAWKAYLVSMVEGHMEGMTSNRPYLYLVPPGDDDASVAQRGLQLSNVSDTVLRTTNPGNLLAFGGADSAKTADLLIAAFADAAPGSFKGVIVLFIGDAADQERVAAALKPSEANYRFVQM